MKVRIGIVTYNRREVLEKAIQSALAQTYEPKEIVVADDASTDGTSSLAEKYPQVKWIMNSERKGCIRARNELMMLAGADAYCSLDDDSWFLDSDALAQAVARLQTDSTIGAIAFTIQDAATTMPAIVALHCGSPILSDADAPTAKHLSSESAATCHFLLPMAWRKRILPCGSMQMVDASCSRLNCASSTTPIYPTIPARESRAGTSPTLRCFPFCATRFISYLLGFSNSFERFGTLPDASASLEYSMASEW
ncbi:MAG: glycosyltransferase family 2 protein [Verrucomicrobiales bacterium]